jgi:hypothetical protein
MRNRIAVVVIMLVGVLLCWSPAAFAQPVEVPANTALTVAWDHDGANTDGFKVYIDGAHIATVNAAARTAPLSPLTPGTTHVIEISAFNTEAEVRSVPLSVYVKRPRPMPPINPRITEVSVGSTGVTVRVGP